MIKFSIKRFFPRSVEDKAGFNAGERVFYIDSADDGEPVTKYGVIQNIIENDGDGLYFHYVANVLLDSGAKVGIDTTFLESANVNLDNEIDEMLGI